jgi:hypothetical protein
MKFRGKVLKLLDILKLMIDDRTMFI